MNHQELMERIGRGLTQLNGARAHKMDVHLSNEDAAAVAIYIGGLQQSVAQLEAAIKQQNGEDK